MKNDHLQHPPRSPTPFVPSVQISRNGSGAAGGDPRDPQLHWQRRPSNVGSTMLTRFIHNPVGSRGDIPLRLWNLHYLLQYNVTCISVGNDYHLLVIPTQHNTVLQWPSRCAARGLGVEVSCVSYVLLYWLATRILIIAYNIRYKTP